MGKPGVRGAGRTTWGVPRRRAPHLEAETVWAVSLCNAPGRQLDRENTEETRRLDDVSRVDLPFPCDFLEMVRPGIQNGTTINGQPGDPWPLSPKSDSERW